MESEANKTEKKAEGSKRWFGRGIYGSKDIPIRILDGGILGMVAVIIIMIVAFAINGGYMVTFDTQGGSEVASQKLRYGKTAAEPEVPIRAGYEFQGWITSLDESLAQEWDFSEDTVEKDITLYAVWTPAEITVKFDLDGGTVDGQTQAPDKQVVFGEAYGGLPVPTKEGCQFDGWVYSGDIITEETMVKTSGEHVLTARWKQ